MQELHKVLAEAHVQVRASAMRMSFLDHAAVEPLQKSDMLSLLGGVHWVRARCGALFTTAIQHPHEFLRHASGSWSMEAVPAPHRPLGLGTSSLSTSEAACRARRWRQACLALLAS